MKIEDVIKLAREAKLQDVTVPATMPGVMMARENVSKWNLPVDHMVLSESVRQRFFADEDFIRSIDPEPLIENVKKGSICTLYGMTVLADLEGVLEQDTIVVVSTIGLEAEKRAYPAERYVFKCRMAV
jgi:hypothetical protein